MKKWEYKTIDMLSRGSAHGDWWSAEMKILGEEGWEMCGATQRYIYFKREL